MGQFFLLFILIILAVILHYVMEMLKSHLENLGLNSGQASLFANAFEERLDLKEGEFFVKEGQVCQHIGFLVSGACRHYYNTERDEITRWMVVPNNFTTSLSSFITETPSKENIGAIKKSVLYLISKFHWQQLYNEHKFIRQFWLSNIEFNYIGMEERVFYLIAKTAEERYQWLLQNYPQINLHVPDKYIASMLGIHPRHLSRIRGSKK